MDTRKPDPDTKAQPMDSRDADPRPGQSTAQPRTNVNPDNVHTHGAPDSIPDGAPREPIGKPATGPQSAPQGDRGTNTVRRPAT